MEPTPAYDEPQAAAVPGTVPPLVERYLEHVRVEKRLAARTDAQAQPPHAGISMFIVPMDTPGITVKPATTMYDGSFANIFYDGVRVPADHLVGPVNGGWKVLTDALANERYLALQLPLDERALASRTQSVKIATTQFIAGRTDMLWVAQLQTEQLATESNLIRLRGTG